MLIMEFCQFVEHVMSMLAARVPVDRLTRHHLVGDPAEPAADLDADVARILARQPPRGGLCPEVIIACDQIIGYAQDRFAERTVAPSHQGPVATIDRVALMS